MKNFGFKFWRPTWQGQSCEKSGSGECDAALKQGNEKMSLLFIYIMLGKRTPLVPTIIALHFNVMSPLQLLSRVVIKHAVP